MDEGFLKTLEQITGILTGYCAGVRAGTALNSQSPVNSPHNQVRRHENSNNLETNCKFIQFIPRAARLVPLSEDIKEVSDGQMMSDTQSISSGGEEDMRYLTKRKDGRWQGSKIVDGKREYVYAKTQLECREKLKNLEIIRRREPKKDSLYVFAKNWLVMYKKGNIADTTYKGYAYLINKHLKITTPINRLTTAELQNIINELPVTRVRKEVYMLIRQIVKKAYELDYIKKDVSQFVQLGKIEKADGRALTVDEQRKILCALGDDPFSYRILLYLVTGARPGELRRINRNEIHLNYIKIEGTKNSRAVRWVKVAPKIIDLIKSLSGEVFNFDLKRFRERLQRFCAELGIDYEVTTYTLRHTFATNLYILRVPEKDRQMYLGHAAGSRMTNDVYTTYSPDISGDEIYKIYGDLFPKF